jgi:hypothetical protein
MTTPELQVAFTIQQHLLRRNYLTDQEQALLNRVQRQIKECIKEVTNRNEEKDKEYHKGTEEY